MNCYRCKKPYQPVTSVNTNVVKISAERCFDCSELYFTDSEYKKWLQSGKTKIFWVETIAATG